MGTLYGRGSKVDCSSFLETENNSRVTIKRKKGSYYSNTSPPPSVLILSMLTQTDSENGDEPF